VLRFQPAYLPTGDFSSQLLPQQLAEYISCQKPLTMFFPCSIVGHLSPLGEDTAALKEGDVVKM
jgi:hypothetical protein